MRIAVTGATGFIGRRIVAQLARQGHQLVCWHRPDSDLSGFEQPDQLTWLQGALGDREACQTLVADCDAVVHSALWRPGRTFRGGEGEVCTFVQTNVVGSLQLIEAARQAGVPRFVFLSTCAVHEAVLDDRPLDETHPMWPYSHYGAHKAAIEEFIYTYGLGQGYSVCAIRPTGVYGVAYPIQRSKWYDLIRQVARGETVQVQGGGKEVHVDDVAQAVSLLIHAENVHGQAYNCYDRYVSQHEVATIVKQLSGSNAEIVGEPKVPRHQIVTDKLEALGMRFGGLERLKATLETIIASL